MYVGLRTIGRTRLLSASVHAYVFDMLFLVLFCTVYWSRKTPVMPATVRASTVPRQAGLVTAANQVRVLC